jgi:NAD-dependent deacetylase
MKKIVVLSGAGISAESGLSTFRDSGGLWEGYDVMEVASIEGWYKNPQLVLEFYNMRRKQALDARPNAGHYVLAKLEEKYEVTIITQNVDNLHEKAGSSKVIHLHGELYKSQSTANPALIYEINGWELNPGDVCEKGAQLRPYIVWFGEAVPMMDIATEIAPEADIFIVVGTSLQVYPAAGLINYVKKETPKYIIDPKPPAVSGLHNLHFIKATGSSGLSTLAGELLK